MYSLARTDETQTMKAQVIWLGCKEAQEKALPRRVSPVASMYECLIKANYDAGHSNGKTTRDSLSYKYQINQSGYDMVSQRSVICTVCLAGGINIWASLGELVL